jgi:hypothetical protein
MKRGRPVKSEIRQNIVDILQYLGPSYGYHIYKVYSALFAECTKEVLYYHLRKGLKTGEFIVKEVKREEGSFSWGPVVEKIYYALGPDAMPRVNSKIKEYVENMQKKVL